MWPFEEPVVPDSEKLALYERAVEELRRAPQGPTDEREWADLGRQLGRLATLRADSGDLDEAIQAFDEVLTIWERLERDKAWMVAAMRHSLLLARRGDHDEAKGAIERLIERATTSDVFKPYFDTLALYRAAILAAAGEAEAAVQDLDRAIEVRAHRQPGSEEKLCTWRNQLLGEPRS